MSLIAPQLRSDRQALSFNVDVRILGLLKQYAAFIESPQDYVAGQALLVTFAKDTHLHGWLQQKAPDDLAHLRGARTTELVRLTGRHGTGPLPGGAAERLTRQPVDRAGAEGAANAPTSALRNAGERWRVSHDDPQGHARRQLLLPVGDNYFCRRRASERVGPRPDPHRVVVVGGPLAEGVGLLRSSRDTMMMGCGRLWETA